MSVRTVRETLDRPIAAVAEREFRTAVRNRSLLAVAGLFLVVVVGLAWTSGPAGYLPLALDLLTPLELLVPALAFAVAYRSVLEDRRHGELAILRTYPVSRATYLGGVYLGRAAFLLPVVLLALAVGGVMVPLLGGPGTDVLVSHEGTDSAVVHLRFVFVTALYSMVALAVGVAVSAIARSGRSVAGASVAVFLVLTVGIDLGVVGGLATGLLGESALELVLSASPTSAYRGLVLESVLDLATTAGVRAANPVTALLGLFFWWAAALAVGTAVVWREESVTHP